MDPAAGSLGDEGEVIRRRRRAICMVNSTSNHSTIQIALPSTEVRTQTERTANRATAQLCPGLLQQALTLAFPQSIFLPHRAFHVPEHPTEQHRATVTYSRRPAAAARQRHTGPRCALSARALTCSFARKKTLRHRQ